MTTKLIVLVLAAGGCAPWAPTSFPVDVFLPGDLPLTHVAAAIYAEKEWEAATGLDLIRLREGPCQSDAICVSSKPPPGGYGGYSTSTQDRCHVKMLANVHPSTMTHEIGHCFGLGHDPNPESLMNAVESLGQHLTNENIRDVRLLVP